MIFFNLEAVPLAKEFSIADPAEVLYQKSTQHNSEGHYIVRLLLKGSCALGDSASQSLKTFYSLEKWISKNPELKA